MNSVWATGLLTLALVSQPSCIKKTLATSKNFVSQDGNTVIFSLSQNELEMGRFRLCKTPYGLNFGQDDAERRPLETEDFKRCKELNRQIARQSQPQFASVNVDASAVTPSETAVIDDFSEIKAPPKPEEATEVQGGEAAPPPSAPSGQDVKVTLETKVVRDEVHSFFSGSHLTPRCWYRFDRQGSGASADFISTDGRVRTLLNSKRLTRYSVSSANIVKSILADDTLRKMHLNVRSEEVLQAAEYNKNLKNVQGNQIYSILVGMAGATAINIPAAQLARLGALLRQGTAAANYEAGKILIEAKARQTGQQLQSPGRVKEKLEALIGRKQAFVDKIKKELADFKSSNGELLDPEKAADGALDAAQEGAKFQNTYLQATLNLEEKQLNAWHARLMSGADNGTATAAKTIDPSWLDNLSHQFGTWLSRGQRMCRTNLMWTGACMGAVSIALGQGTQFAIDKYTVLGFRNPTAADMEVSDLEMAANMFSSTKFNVELSRQDIELLAATNSDYSQSSTPFGIPLPQWGNRQVNRKNLGFIPILGDSPKSGIVCPVPAVAALIVGLEEPDGKKFQLLKKAMTEAGMTYIDSAIGDSSSTAAP